MQVNKLILRILLDFSKAFEKVSHQRLLHKLFHYGIKGPLHNWMRDFLQGRQQQILLGNKNSHTSSVLSGVPQGLVLGPLLFLLYINDFPSRISSTIRLYADDVILYKEINPEEDILLFQTDLSIIACWARDWLVSLNLSKCEHLTITNKRNPINSFYKLNDQVLRKVTKAKYLGVTINQTLS